MRREACVRERAAAWVRGALPLVLAGLLFFQAGAATVFAAAPAEAIIPPAMEARARAVFERLVDVLRADYPELETYTIQVVHEKVANAWINQDHQIFVTTGLMDLMETDDQLGGVIGHEIAHGIMGHIPHRINQSLWSAFAVLALGMLSSTQGPADWGGLLEMRDLFMYAYSREQESEADLVGMRLAQRAGYDPRGLVEALERMDSQRRGLSPDSVWQQLYQTHPPLSQRISELRLVLATDALSQSPRSGNLLMTGNVAQSPEEAARRFAQAMWSGDRETMEQLALPRHTSQVSDWLSGQAGRLDPGWAKAELEIAERRTQGLDQVLVVRLWRPLADSDGGEESTPLVALSLRRSARGWLVADWRLEDL